MTPPPPFIAANAGWWNVEHFDPNASMAVRELRVRNAEQYQLTATGPYAAHEGFPGHHLQRSVARVNPDPLRI